MSRRHFVGSIAGTAGLALTAGLWTPAASQGPDSSPKPIPGGIQPLGPGTEVFHFFLPAPGAEPSLITDFNGIVGLAAIEGEATRTDTRTGTKTKLNYDTDMRFMKGSYIGVDGAEHIGAFAFV